MSYVDPILAERYREACRRSCRAFVRAKAEGFPDDLMQKLTEAQALETQALADLECGHGGKSVGGHSSVFPVSKEGEKGRTIRESVMKEFGMTIPERVRKSPAKQDAQTDVLGLFA